MNFNSVENNPDKSEIQNLKMLMIAFETTVYNKKNYYENNNRDHTYSLCQALLDEIRYIIKGK